MRISKKLEEGQALVLVLLSLAVVLTLVLFILARSVTDVAVTSTQEESVRAFSAAEAGIERALVIGVNSGRTTIGDASYQATVTGYGQSSSNFVYPIDLSSGDSATIWFMSHDSNGNLLCDGTSTYPCFNGNSIKICWGKSGTPSDANTTPAIELSVYYESTPGNLPTIKIARAAIDPHITRNPSNGFSAPDPGTCSLGDKTYAFQKTITFSNLNIPSGSYNIAGGLQFARIKMLYNTDMGQELGIDVSTSGKTLPSQGQLIDSTGVACKDTACSNGGVSNRRIQVFQGWPEIPNIFENAIFSSAGLTKN